MNRSGGRAPGSMLSVALTGNVASGKSTVCRLFAEWGATVIDADELVREVQRPGSPVLAAIRERFGDGVIQRDGTLDRAAVRDIVFADAEARAALEAIVHPAVERRRAELLAAAQARGDRIVVNDIPLLFEAADPTAFDVVIVVDAPVDVRRARLISDRGLASHEADRMLAAQLSAEGKRARAHIVIDNDGTLNQLRDRARSAWHRLLDLTFAAG